MRLNPSKRKGSRPISIAPPYFKRVTLIHVALSIIILFSTEFYVAYLDRYHPIIDDDIGAGNSLVSLEIWFLTLVGATIMNLGLCAINIFRNKPDEAATHFMYTFLGPVLFCLIIFAIFIVLIILFD